MLFYAAFVLEETPSYAFTARLHSPFKAAAIAHFFYGYSVPVPGPFFTQSPARAPERLDFHSMPFCRFPFLDWLFKSLQVSARALESKSSVSLLAFYVCSARVRLPMKSLR